MANSTPCSVCGGQKSEHGPDTVHAYTVVPGDLAPPQKPASAAIPPGLLMSSGQNPISFGRLIEVLLDRELISPEDALYIAGFAPKPTPQFADPLATLQKQGL